MLLSIKKMRKSITLHKSLSNSIYTRKSICMDNMHTNSNLQLHISFTFSTLIVGSSLPLSVVVLKHSFFYFRFNSETHIGVYIAYVGALILTLQIQLEASNSALNSMKIKLTRLFALFNTLRYYLYFNCIQLYVVLAILVCL